MPQADADVADLPVACLEHGDVPDDLRQKTLANLDPNERTVWVGQPIPKIVLVRSWGYFAAGAVIALIAMLWLVLTLLPVRANVRGQGKAPVAAASLGSPILPLGLLLASIGVAGAVPLYRWRTATRTCYALTNRRAIVFKEGLFGPTRDSYSPLEVSAMNRRDSWLGGGNGDLVFKTVNVVSRADSIWEMVLRTNVKTIRYGFLAISDVAAVEKVVRETLIDRFVDKLNRANSLA
jgi:hypothetical protein